MLAVILKELRCYTNTNKYRCIQLLILCGFALVLLVGTVEFYAYHTIEVGKQTYKLCIIFIFYRSILGGSACGRDLAYRTASTGK